MEHDTAFDEDTLHDVAIIGLGPCGASLANLLGQQGLKVLVIEKEGDIFRLPRAIHFDGECMRAFQAMGIVGTLYPHLLVSPGMKFVDAAGRVLIDYSRSRELGPQGWHPSYRFHQPQLEEVLRTRMHDHETVQVRLRHEAFSIEPKADRVVLRVENMASGRLKTAQARYVVGCDGARSLVRRFMGTELDDMNSHERWLVLDVLLHRDRPDLGDHSIQYCDPVRPSTYVRGVGNRRRWELMLMPGDDPVSIVRPESVWALLARWVTPEDGVIERPAVYTFHSVVARGWRRDRLLIAGDAAHQTPPFMGQGMCAGIRDAFNLAWKLVAVVKGQFPPSLLDTYESERSPHVREFIETAVRLGGVIQTTDEAISRERDARMSANPEVFKTPQPALGPGWHAGGNVAGRVAPQPLLDNGERFDDGLGDRFALIVAPDALRACAVEGHGQLVVREAKDAAVKQWLNDLGCVALLLRPDRHIAAVATQAADINDMVQRYVAEGVPA
ncbi:bifunctional 3-(3-hydroxy-phenyl)propionate/3-hydroxycinnamic acid hydroxylase MhpA [Hydrogenophaga sp.]|uniref:bifunctional 3-(3-hydroxy-phenyl)propionate/3-hydroxycinnamic acid hydroxylase MhpA n=1 Tax=Hydrogenophaga sp. TaxID=1904254 RepID=UPI002FC9E8AD